MSKRIKTEYTAEVKINGKEPLIRFNVFAWDRNFAIKEAERTFEYLMEREDIFFQVEECYPAK